MHTHLMTIFIQYNVNNHILDGACYIWWPSVFPGGEFVSVLSKHLLNLESLYIILAMSGNAPAIYINVDFKKDIFEIKIHIATLDNRLSVTINVAIIICG